VDILIINGVFAKILENQPPPPFDFAQGREKMEKQGGRSKEILRDNHIIFEIETELKWVKKN